MRMTPTPARARDPRPALFESEGIEVPDQRPMVRGGLLLYHFPTASWFRDAATIMDHASAFQRYSRFGIEMLSTDVVLPRRIAELDFQLVIVHYSVFGAGLYQLTEDHLRWLETSRGHKVAFPQDEYRNCGQRFWFCDEVGLDTIYTMHLREDFEATYLSHTGVKRIRNSLPGYASEAMEANADRLRVADAERPVDVGYRARAIAPYAGRGGQEKQGIGRSFRERAADSGLVLDIEVDEEDRIYGDDWPRFISRCKAVLGVESGVSVIDLEDKVIDQWEKLTAEGRQVTVEDLTEAAPLEDRIFYRTISPRHFEAAAMRTCQILFEGRYSGVMEPMRHYIPLKKDFSNFDEVLRLFRDDEVRRELTDNAYRDMIASGRWSYERFIDEFDRDMIDAGLEPEVPKRDAALARRAVRRGRRRRIFQARLRWAYYKHLAPDPWAVIRHKLFTGPAGAVRARWQALMHRVMTALGRT